jgi:hypothetical protein
MRRAKVVVAGIVSVAALLHGAAAFAHHSFGMFDSSKSLVLKGTLKEVEWTNPHNWFYISVPDSEGHEATWAIEGGTIAEFARLGFSKKDFKPGVKVETMIHPLRDGRQGGQFLKMTFADGRTVGKGQSAFDTLIDKGLIKK